MIMAQEQKWSKGALDKLTEIVAFLDECIREGKRADQAERGVFEGIWELGRKMMERFIELSGDGDVGETYEHEGKCLHRSAEKHRKYYRGLFGALSISRYVYSAGEHEKAVSPLDRRLGLPAGEQSYLLEDWVGRLTTRMSYAEAVDFLEETLGVKTTVRASEGMVERMAQHVESYRAQAAPPEKEPEENLLVVSADGKGVPMRRSLEQRLEEEQGVRPHKRHHKTEYAKARKRRCRGTPRSRKQMAYVGTVYGLKPWPRKPEALLDEVHRKEAQQDRPRLENKRYWAEMTQVHEDQVCPGAERLFARLRGELLGRDPERRRLWICVMDGQRSLWELMKRHLPEAIGILDVYHVTVKLWQASYDFHPEGSAAAEDFVDRYLRMLLEGKVGYVIGVFRRFENRRGSKRVKKKGLREAIRYFEANREAMRYDEYLKAGYPIGSGVVEGACRHVVKDRMEGAGMRWQIEGAQALLHLRTTCLNQEWPAFIEHRIEREQTALYGTAA